MVLSRQDWLKSMVASWQDQKSCTKRELLSFVGVLQNATLVICYGRVFLRRMIKLSKQAKGYHHFVHLNRDFRSDTVVAHLPTSLKWKQLPPFRPSADNRNNSMLRCIGGGGASGYWAWCQPTFKWFHGSGLLII